MDKIYIVEDDENIRNLLKIALEGFGYEAQGFETAEEGLEQIAQNPPDLVIFDWMLPGMDGVAAIRQLRQTEEGRDMPIMLLTAKEKELDKVVGLDCGADDYMVKPFGVLELSAGFGAFCAGSAGRKQRHSFLSGDQSSTERHGGCEQRPVCGAYSKEFELLVYLLENQSRVVTRDELLNRIWAMSTTGRRVPWICIYGPSGRSWERRAEPASRRCGAWATG